MAARYHQRLLHPYFQVTHCAYSAWWAQSAPREPLFEKSLLLAAISENQEYQMLLQHLLL